MSAEVKTYTSEALAAEDDPDPLPLDEESLLKQLTDIRELWAQHDQARRSDSLLDDEDIKADLYEAYSQLEIHAQFLQSGDAELTIGQDLLEAARFELWTSCHHLSKMLK